MFHVIDINLIEALRFLLTTGIGPFKCKEMRVSLFHFSGTQWVKEDITYQPPKFIDKRCQVMICRVNSFFDALNEQNSYDAFVKYSKELIAQLMFCLHRRSTDKKQLHIYLHPEKNSNDNGFTKYAGPEFNEIRIFCGNMNSKRQCAGTIIHEMGHAILPIGNGHNNFWFTTTACLMAAANLFVTNRSKEMPVVSITGSSIQ